MSVLSFPGGRGSGSGLGSKGRSQVRALLFAMGVALALLSSAAPARAQSIAVVNENSLPRLDAEGNSTKKRQQNQEPEGVSFQDCLDDQRIQFTLQLADFAPAATLEAWASLSGADCKDQTKRSGNSQVCWNLLKGIQLSSVTTVTIPVRKIMSGVLSATDPDETVAACGQIDLVTIGVHFLYFKPGELATPAVDKALQIKVDTVGPSAPTGLRVYPGNTRITVEWDNISGEGGVSLLTGVKVYCDPAGSVADASTDDAGQTCHEEPNDAGPDADGGDAGTTTVCEPNEAGTSTPGGGDCTSGNLTTPDGKARIPDNAFNERFQCGNFSGNAGTSVVAEGVGGTPLVNGTRYAVAVAATDAYLNVGPLSGLICEMPEPTTDFWEDYKNSGGAAGGGYCTTSGPGLPVGSLSVCGIAALVALGSLRRTWRKRR